MTKQENEFMHDDEHGVLPANKPVAFMHYENGFYYYAGACCDFSDPHTNVIASATPLSPIECGQGSGVGENGTSIGVGFVDDKNFAAIRERMRSVRRLVDIPSMVFIPERNDEEKETPQGQSGLPKAIVEQVPNKYYRFSANDGSESTLKAWIENVQDITFKRSKISFAQISQNLDGTATEPIAFCYELFSPVGGRRQFEFIEVKNIIRGTTENHNLAWISIENEYGSNPRKKFTDQCLVSWNAL